ncbi:MAG: cupin domain-containing protein [Proteobacteria bacterium]|nr:cupin domain-containing protein [Pseudomonadota bacterium]
MVSTQIDGLPQQACRVGSSRYSPGISAETSGATSLFLGLLTLPAGQRTKAHMHERHESAHYMLSGEEVELWTGPREEHSAVARPGDYLFIPAGMPHVVVNRCGAAAVFMGACNEPAAQESVLLGPELDSLVPLPRAGYAYARLAKPSSTSSQSEPGACGDQKGWSGSSSGSGKCGAS